MRSSIDGSLAWMAGWAIRDVVDCMGTLRDRMAAIYVCLGGFEAMEIAANRAKARRWWVRSRAHHESKCWALLDAVGELRALVRPRSSGRAVHAARCRGGWVPRKARRRWLRHLHGSRGPARAQRIQVICPPLHHRAPRCQVGRPVV